MKQIFPMMLCLLILLCGCASEESTDIREVGNESGYKQISQEEAKRMMALDDGHVVVDVRRRDEYEAGHIPGAILLPNETIGCDAPEALPDYDQIVLIYCRTGNRSKQAAEKLAAMGYTSIYEFGGILDWTGEIVTRTGDSGSDAAVKQDNDEEKQTMKLKIGETEVPVSWEENASVDALKALAEKETLIIQMSMYGGFEQVGPIGQSIARDDRQMTTEAGDIVLYSGNQIVVFYGSNSWAYTRLGHVELSQEEMETLLGNGDVVLTLQMEN